MGGTFEDDRKSHHTGSSDYVGRSWRPESESNNVQKNDGCFVASAVYGGGDVEQVKVLREYRDNILMQDELGKKFVEWYYGGGGEKMAEFVGGKRRFLIPIIKKGLDFIVEDYKQRRI